MAAPVNGEPLDPGLGPARCDPQIQGRVRPVETRFRECFRLCDGQCSHVYPTFRPTRQSGLYGHMPERTQPSGRCKSAVIGDLSGIHGNIWEHTKTLGTRRGWDSNPRYRCRYTSFPGWPIQPLLHPSGFPRNVESYPQPRDGQCAGPIWDPLTVAKSGITEAPEPAALQQLCEKPPDPAPTLPSLITDPRQRARRTDGALCQRGAVYYALRNTY